MIYKETFKILNKIYNEGAYSNIELQKLSGENSQKVVRVVKGVLENDYRLKVILTDLLRKVPNEKINIVLKIGIYLLVFSENKKDYAVVNEGVEFVKSLKMQGLSGLVNAVLKKAARGEYKIPCSGTEKIAYDGNIPVWLAERLINSFGENLTSEMLKRRDKVFHIMINPDRYSKSEFIEFLNNNDIEYKESVTGGFLTKFNCNMEKLFNEGKITYISLCSSIIAEECEGEEVLDLCGAPGGKSILLAMGGKKVTVCDIHPHRLELVKSYFKRMGLSCGDLIFNDASKLNEKFIDKFPCVLLDAPCTGFGVISKKPDILLNKNEDDIESLATLQAEMLECASRYVKKSGLLVYSTCTITDEENRLQIKNFLNNHNEFVLEEGKFKGDFSNFGEQFLSIRYGYEGFFLAKLRRVY